MFDAAVGDVDQLGVGHPEEVEDDGILTAAALGVLRFGATVHKLLHKDAVSN